VQHAACLESVKTLKTLGVDAEAIDVAGVADVFRFYHAALTGPRRRCGRVRDEGRARVRLRPHDARRPHLRRPKDATDGRLPRQDQAGRPRRVRKGTHGLARTKGDPLSTIPEDYSHKGVSADRIYNLKEFGSYPDPLNSTEELLDKQIAPAGATARSPFRDKVLTYKQLLGRPAR